MHLLLMLLQSCRTLGLCLRLPHVVRQSQNPRLHLSLLQLNLTVAQLLVDLLFYVLVLGHILAIVLFFRGFQIALILHVIHFVVLLVLVKLLHSLDQLLLLVLYICRCRYFLLSLLTSSGSSSGS